MLCPPPPPPLSLLLAVRSAWAVGPILLPSRCLHALLVLSLALSTACSAQVAGATEAEYLYSNSSRKYSCSVRSGPPDLVWGVYAQTGITGASLHLFPDHRFAVIGSCDVCPEEVLSRGTYAFANGQLALDYVATEHATARIERWDFLSGCPLPMKSGHEHLYLLVRSDRWDRKGRAISTDHVLLQQHRYEDWSLQADTFFRGTIKPKGFPLILPPTPSPPPPPSRRTGTHRK
jgi:hypothetical protein